MNLKFSNQRFSQLKGIDDNTKDEFLQDMKRFYDSNDGRSKLKRLDEDRVLINGKFVKRMVMPIVIEGQCLWSYIYLVY